MIEPVIKPESKTIKQLLGDVKYSIDYYQREYKWKEAHIQELIDDLDSKFELYYDKTHERKNVNKYGRYFLGTIILTKEGGINYIIDGQQRLTSFTLLLIYLRNLQIELRHVEKVDVNQLIYSEDFGEKSYNIKDPYDSDREECIDALYRNKDYDPIGKSESVNNMIDRYRDIEKSFPDSRKDKSLPYFIDWYLQKVHVVQITTYSKDEAYTIFETTNDRGLRLSQTEMLKGYVLTKIDNEKDREEANKFWKRRIQKLKELDNKDSDLKFFHAWFRAKYAQTIRIGKKGSTNKDFERIASESHKWVRENDEKWGLKKSNNFKEFILKNFDKFSQIYLDLWNYAENFREEYEYIYYNALNHFTLQYPLILASIKLTDDKETIKKKIQIISAYIDILIARRIAKRRTLAYSSIKYTMFNLMKEIRDLSLIELAAEINKKIDDMEENFDDILNFSLRNRNKFKVRYLLARITYCIEKETGLKSNFEDYISYKIKDPFEIEHIWANKYERYKDDFSNEREFEEYRDRLGGLLLLPKSFNQSYGKDPYKDKLVHYFSQNLLAKSLHERCYERNPSFLKFKNRNAIPFKAHPQFKKDDLDIRQKLYRKICEYIWDPSRIDKILADK
ncbi:hypothetical protein LCGC14_1198720 [marine sediment metagenome]|uniref:DUF262 domain-containing protein n=1 Tax=marine sediment metagenome TaxID=412755 RepID=A0A0F9PMC2_9ZZZZ